MPHGTALVTGASSGIGEATALELARLGYTVYGAARGSSGHRAERMKELEAQGIRILKMDVTDDASMVAGVERIIAEQGRLDVLVNNAGYGNIGSIEDTSLAEFRAQIETNLFGVIDVTKAAIPLMREQGSGHIIQFSSVGGRVGPIGRAPYAAAKWGVEGFSEVLAKELGPLGVKVTIIEPGGFRTDFAGSSTAIREGRPEYDSTVGRAARFQRDFNGAQPGDPAKAAKAIIQITGLDKPPLRLLLGSDAVKFAEQNDLARMENDRQWRDLSVSTDFEASGSNQ
jgi:NAD(P)-dependent dehydrogenase (short-subunit alcohol dehydrogenase family)